MMSNLELQGVVAVTDEEYIWRLEEEVERLRARAVEWDWLVEQGPFFRLEITVGGESIHGHWKIRTWRGVAHYGKTPEEAIQSTREAAEAK